MSVTSVAPVVSVFASRRDGGIAAAQALAHDPGTDNRRQQQCRSEHLFGKAACERHGQQPGAQQPAGLFARTKALMNLS